MLGKVWKLVLRISLIAAAVLAFLVVMELIRAFQTLHELHPVAGYAFLGLAGLLVLWSLGRLMGGWRHRPKVLRPPDIGKLDEAKLRMLRKHGRYLWRYLHRLGKNPVLSEEKRDFATASAVELRLLTRKTKDRNELCEALKKAEGEQIEPLLQDIDALAEAEVQQCMVHVMMGVAASPWDAVDLLVVLYRNGSMITRITRFYNSRPPLRERLSVFVDTLRIVAMIKFASLSSGLIKKCTNVPLVGRALEPLVQAVGAGVLTSAAGHAAMHRCRAFRRWDQQEAAKHLGMMVGQYLTDCWRAARHHILPILEQKLKGIPIAAWGAIRNGFGSAVDATAKAADSLVGQPVASAARAVGRGTRSFFSKLFGHYPEPVQPWQPYPVAAQGPMQMPPGASPPGAMPPSTPGPPPQGVQLQPQPPPQYQPQPQYQPEPQPQPRPQQHQQRPQPQPPQVPQPQPGQHRRQQQPQPQPPAQQPPSQPPPAQQPPAPPPGGAPKR